MASSAPAVLIDNSLRTSQWVAKGDHEDRPGEMIDEILPSTHNPEQNPGTLLGQDNVCQSPSPSQAGSIRSMNSSRMSRSQARIKLELSRLKVQQQKELLRIEDEKRRIANELEMRKIQQQILMEDQKGKIAGEMKILQTEHEVQAAELELSLLESDDDESYVTVSKTGFSFTSKIVGIEESKHASLVSKDVGQQTGTSVVCSNNTSNSIRNGVNDTLAVSSHNYTPTKVRRNDASTVLMESQFRSPAIGMPDNMNKVDCANLAPKIKSEPQVLRSKCHGISPEKRELEENILPSSSKQNPPQRKVHLPNPEIMKFTGDPMKFPMFVQSFKAHVVDLLDDDDVLFTYLLQHCSDPIKNEIEHFSMLPYGHRYAGAMEFLEDEYGQNYIISDRCLHELKNGPRVQRDDVQGLKLFARELRKCQMILRERNEYFNFSVHDNLLAMVQRLPTDTQRLWDRKVAKIKSKSMRAANYDDFVAFVSKEEVVAKSPFRSSRTYEGKGQEQSRKISRPRVAAYAMSTSPPDGSQGTVCLYCEGLHELSMCEEFRKESRSKRYSLVRSNGLCFKCLKGRHLARDCKEDIVCGVQGCKQPYHHTLLHRYEEDDNQNSGNEVRSNVNPTNVVGCHVVTLGDVQSCRSTNDSTGVYLNIVPVRVQANGLEYSTYAFLDHGSTTSLCSQKLVDALKLTGESKVVSLLTVGNEPKNHKAVSVSLSVTGMNGDCETIKLPSVLSIDKITVTPNLMPASKRLKRLPYLHGLKFPRIENGEVDLLIGANVPESLVIQETRIGQAEQPIAVRTKFGWSLMGPSLDPAKGTLSVNFVKVKDVELQSQIECLWKTDFEDLSSLNDKPTSREDRIAHKRMIAKVQHVNGHYELPLLWRDEHQRLQDNRLMAEKRLAHLKRRLMKDDILRAKYVETLEGYINKGYACRVTTEDELSSIHDWYLPHHPVLHPRKPDKVRVVFDCAAKCNGVSLNDVLMSGPDLVNSLVGVLMRFRKEAIALVADIESMFHQIRVTPEDRSALKFLWWPGGDLTKEPESYCMTVHLFGATSSPSCASFCLRQTARDFGDQYSSDVSKTVNECFYVDDCLPSEVTEDKAITLVQQLRQILDSGGFRLTKWISNSEKVIESIPMSERSKLVNDKFLDNDMAGRILGVYWNVPNDEFGFKFEIPNKPMTRRGILSALSSLYDPMGFVAPVTVCAKVLLQDLCRQRLQWDEPISEIDEKRWKAWVEDLPQLDDVKISRCFKPENFGLVLRWEIHHFADASSIAYGAVSYLRLTDNHSRVHCSFLIGRSRLVPIKAVSIPRLELTAAVLAVKLDRLVKRELGLEECESTFWTDSTAVLQSIRNSTKRFSTFVANRLTKIDAGSSVYQWRHVPTKLNPGDDASRGLTIDNMLKDGRWLHGPQFLWEPESTWPVDPENMEPPPPEFQPKDEPVRVNHLDTSEVIVGDHVPCTSRLIRKYSTWYRLHRAVAWLLRYKEYLRSKVQGTMEDLNFNKMLTVNELQVAETELIKYVQGEHFSDVMKACSNEAYVWKKSSCSRALYKLCPVMIDGVLRVGGRLGKAPISDDAKHPIILPHRHHLTDLLIVKCHCDVGHCGMSHTWATMRQRYWVLKGGSAVRRVLGNCIFCRKRNASVEQQFMADLPSERLKPHSFAFEFVGVDYFGPLMVKQGRSLVKTYGCLFTCLNVRAVHIELADNMTTDSFISALRRFIGRRGKPSILWSDNGTNFVGANRELKDSLLQWNQQQIADYLTQHNIQWNFNPPAASSMGGIWERMIRTVRRILPALMKEQTVTREMLETILVEVESIMNSRPVVPVMMDPTAEEPLTPNHLLLLRSSQNMAPGVFVRKDCHRRHHWRQVQYIANQFWHRWLREYLPTIIERQKWFVKRRNLENDDLVLVVDESIPRSRWKIGRVIERYPDKHGLVRSVKVKAGCSVIKRPVTKLCLVMKKDEDHCAT